MGAVVNKEASRLGGAEYAGGQAEQRWKRDKLTYFFLLGRHFV
jgi:hypothetical protein